MEDVEIRNHSMDMFEEQSIDLLKKQILGSNNIKENVEGNLLKYQNQKLKKITKNNQFQKPKEKHQIKTVINLIHSLEKV